MRLKMPWATLYSLSAWWEFVFIHLWLAPLSRPLGSSGSPGISSWGHGEARPPSFDSQGLDLFPEVVLVLGEGRVFPCHFEGGGEVARWLKVEEDLRHAKTWLLDACYLLDTEVSCRGWLASTINTRPWSSLAFIERKLMARHKLSSEEHFLNSETLFKDLNIYSNLWAFY